MLGGALAAGGAAAYFVKGYIGSEVQAEREQLQKQYRLINVDRCEGRPAAGLGALGRTVAFARSQYISACGCGSLGAMGRDCRASAVTRRSQWRDDS